MFTKKDNQLIYSFDNETVLIEPWGKNSLRVRITHNKDFTGNNWALLEPKHCQAEIVIHEEEPEPVDVFEKMFGGEINNSYAAIKNGKIAAYVNSEGVLTFKNSDGRILLQEDWKRLKDRPSMALNIAGRDMKSVGGNNYRCVIRFRPNDDEKLFGMGQYQQTHLDMKGCSLELAHRNSQASVPFVVSNQGYGFLWNNPAIGRATFAKNGTEWLAESTKEVDYWITAGDTPAEIVEQYADVTGKVPMMPDYGMGFWQCKLRYRTQEEVLEVARKHKELGLPLDVIVIDFFHWTQQGEWKFDPQYWPDPEKMIQELNDMGIQVMVSIWPTVDYRSENFGEMMEKGYLVRTERGVRLTMQLFGQQVFMDPTNPGTREFLWNKVKENYWDKGVRIFWLDEAEPEYTVYDYDNYRYYLGSHLEVGNVYPVMYAKTFFEGMKKEGMENPLNLIRCAWAGIQRYGALCWSGDIDSTWDAMRRQVQAGLSMGMAGIPWFTTDIGGFHGARIDDEGFQKLLMRWFQFGCFSPVFRLHGFRFPVRGFEGDMISGVGKFGSGDDNEVWSYGEECFEIMKKYLVLRERLRPYIKEQMRTAHEKGTPVMRPLFYDFPEDQASWNIEDQYMFGPDILVAPVMEEDRYERDVYLPAGAEWTNAWTGEKFAGGQTIKVDAPLDKIPLFLKDDAKLPIKE